MIKLSRKSWITAIQFALCIILLYDVTFYNEILKYNQHEHGFLTDKKYDFYKIRNPLYGGF